MQWAQNSNYNTIKTMLQHIKVVNDSAERALGLVTTYNDQTITKSKEQKQYLYQVVHNLRQQQNKLKEKKNIRKLQQKSKIVANTMVLNMYYIMYNMFKYHALFI